MSTTLTRSLAALVLAGTVALATGTAAAHPGHDDDAAVRPGRLTPAQTNAIRQETKRFADVDEAAAAGYLPTEACAALPGVGGMGYHYVNPVLASDAVVDPLRPEVLLYERTAQGRLRLVGVEYFVADDDQDLRTDADRPDLFGQPFEGPMPGHEPGMPVHFDLHLWLYEHNPSGQLASWNPRVGCP